MSPLYRRVGPYEIRSELGAGGMSDVYVAEDVRSGGTVALKIPRRDPDVRHAERQGARLQQCLAERDARVARVHEIGEDDGVAYVAMEYVPGEDLSERIARGPLEPGTAIRIAIELLDLLAVAHAFQPPLDGVAARRGIVHGDLKPRNVRLDPEGHVRVVDFGIAKALSETRTRTRNDFGSLPYSSPERVNTGQVDGQSDLWSVAIVLSEMLTGRPPFQADTPRQLEQQLLAHERPELALASGPPALAAVLRKALHPELSRRYSGALAFRSDLEAVLAGVRTTAESEERLNPVLEATRRTFGDETRRTPGEETRRSVPVNAGAPDETTKRHGRNGHDEATRRTNGLGVSNGAAPNGNGTVHGSVAANGTATALDLDGTGSSATTAAAAPRPRRNWAAIGRRVAVFLVAALFVNEVLVMSAASDLESRLPTFTRADANTVWANYRSIRGRSLLRVGSLRLGWRIKDWNVAMADDLMSDYLSETPTIRERGWQQALALLQRAENAAPGDSKVRARRNYAQGQLARIDAEASRERGAAPEARARFNSARRSFEEASRLRRDWPDPWLGLARVYAIGFADVEQTSEALQNAEHEGYRLGNRETALLADAHRLRAERTWTAISGLPDEERYLARVREDGEKALDLYDQVPAYGEVSRNIRRVHQLLAKVSRREEMLSAGQPAGVLGALKAIFQ